MDAAMGLLILHVFGTLFFHLRLVGFLIPPAVTGVNGGDEDVFLFLPTSLGTATAGSFQSLFDGSAEAMPTNVDISGLWIDD